MQPSIQGCFYKDLVFWLSGHHPQCNVWLVTRTLSDLLIWFVKPKSCSLTLWPGIIEPLSTPATCKIVNFSFHTIMVGYGEPVMFSLFIIYGIYFVSNICKKINSIFIYFQWWAAMVMHREFGGQIISTLTHCSPNMGMIGYRGKYYILLFAHFANLDTVFENSEANFCSFKNNIHKQLLLQVFCFPFFSQN